MIGRFKFAAGGSTFCQCFRDSKASREGVEMNERAAWHEGEEAGQRRWGHPRRAVRGVARPMRQGGLVIAVCMLLSGCDQLGIETPQKAAEAKAAEAKAIGSACRHALRAIEDCYTLNPQADKAAVFGGWREMDEYMRENKLDGIAPVVPRPPVEAAPKGKGAASRPKADADEDEEVVEEEPAEPVKGRKGKSAT